MRTLLIAAMLVCSTAPALAAAESVAFIGPSGWSHSPPPDTVDPKRTVDQWHISGDVSTVTFVKDTTSAYPDALGAIEKNLSTNSIKASVDKDTPCRGATGHVVEFAFGPDGHRIVINRLLVPDGTGVDTVTYARADGAVFDADVKTAETSFCASAP